ncbi:rhombosortase [Marinimicrobium sp. ABcell2]|uniref:rhombosortase n=1 Tax=Marinimicrobium sp. ABcell2 TaxID=3069751 RepID=UPI0027B6D3E4|nr:rhombosortase [Marinimicrobium sp. ABcell2]MDQ2075112.1 rhombosortase [Marinimicrobium sp. ABcell2]
MSQRRLSASLTTTFVLAALMLVLGLMPFWSVPALEFNRTLITEGQWWRLLTGHWVHYGVYHLAMNAFAFVLCGYILLRHLPLSHYSLLTLTCLLGVGAGLYWLSPELHYYAGLSGALHGLLVAGVLLSFKDAPWIAAAVLVVLSAKLIQEQGASFDPEHPLLPVPVAVDAHLYGAVIGFVWGVSVHIFRQLKLRAH